MDVSHPGPSNAELLGSPYSTVYRLKVSFHPLKYAVQEAGALMADSRLIVLTAGLEHFIVAPVGHSMFKRYSFTH